MCIVCIEISKNSIKNESDFNEIKKTTDFTCDSALEFYYAEMYKTDTIAYKACECGTEKSNLGGHSFWCPKYDILFKKN